VAAGDAGDVHHRAVERHRVGDAGDQAINARHVERIVDQDVGALGELDEIVGRRGVAGDYDRAVDRVEPISERWHDGWVVHDCGRHLHVQAFGVLALFASRRGDAAFRSPGRRVAI